MAASRIPCFDQSSPSRKSKIDNFFFSLFSIFIQNIEHSITSTIKINPKNINKTSYLQLVSSQMQADPSSQVTSLNLSCSPDSYPRSLALLPTLHIRTLFLSRCRINAQNIGAVAEQPWPNLEQLVLADNMIDGLALRSLLGVLFGSLKFLYLQQNPIGSGGAKALAKLRLQGLVELDIARTQLGTEGARHLLKANWPRLQALQAHSNEIGLDAHEVGYWVASDKLLCWEAEDSDRGGLTAVMRTLWRVLVPGPLGEADAVAEGVVGAVLGRILKDRMRSE